MAEKTTVLVIDDIPLMRVMLIKYLRLLGLRLLSEGEGTGQLEILEAADGQQALDLLKSETGPKVDVLFLDLMMPVMDGLTFLARKNEDDALRSIPVVVCSAISERQTIERATELGACGYIVKPFTMTGVEKKFRAALLDLQT